MEEENSSWVRRAKLSQTIIRRSNSTKEAVVLPNSSSKFARNLNFKSFSLESKPRSLNLEKLKIPLPKPSVQEPQSPKLNIKPEVDLASIQKPKPSIPEAEPFSFYPDANVKLSSKWSDSTPTPPTPTLVTKSSNFSFHNDHSSRWLNSSIIPNTPSFKGNSNSGESKTKRRSLSPLPTTILSDVFHEAKSIGRKFSTPPRKKNAQITTNRAELSPMKHLSSLRAAADKPKRGGRVNAVDCIDEWTIDLSKLYLGLRFAAGAHSKLYHGMYNDSAVAVKIIRQPEDDENGVMAARLENQFLTEVSFLSQLRHPNVIKLIGACKNPPVFCVITEYLSGGSLRAVLHKHYKESLPLQKLVSISLEIARGMEYIHSQGVVHRDLKPENILFDQDLSVKIADFGIASNEKYCNALIDQDMGTYRWMAPEMIKHKSYCRKVDVYSFGLILWEMVTLRVPYEEMTPIQAAFAVVNKKLRPVIPEECPSCIRALIEQCWASVADKRPEFWQIVRFLEHVEVAIGQDGTLNSIQNLSNSDHKKLMFQWMNPKVKHSNVDGKGSLNPKFL